MTAMPLTCMPFLLSFCAGPPDSRATAGPAAAAERQR
jgi:hypothetical protein